MNRKRKSITELLKKKKQKVKMYKNKPKFIGKTQINPIPPECDKPKREYSLLHQYVYGNTPIDYRDGSGSDSD